MYKRVLLAVSLLFSFNAFAQELVFRGEVGATTTVPFQMVACADDEGYISTLIQYRKDQNVFILTNKGIGEAGRLQTKLIVTEVLGFISNENEFAVFFRAQVGAKKELFFISFMKDGSRGPVIKPWANPLNGKFAFGYQSAGRIIIIHEEKDKLYRTEVVAPATIRKTAFAGPYPALRKRSELGFSMKDAWPQNKMVLSTWEGQSVVYDYGDSALVTNVHDESLRVLKFDYLKMTVSEVVVPGALPAASSILLGDRLIQRSSGMEEILIKLFEYPSMNQIKAYRFDSKNPISIKTGVLKDTEMQDAEAKWNEAGRETRIIRKLARGIPFLSAQLHEGNILLQIGSVEYQTGSTMTPSGAFMAVSTGEEVYYYLDACMDRQGEPCTRPVAFPWSILKLNEIARKEQYRTRSSASAVNRDSYYQIFFSAKSGELFIEEFRK